jgi:indole-3-glycerol phosphate synthase
VGTILDRILEQKNVELKRLQQSMPINYEQKQRKSLIKRLQNADEISIIAEFKRSSPSKGMINNLVEPAEQAKIYEKYGASAISVLTDETFFKGSFTDLAKVREVVDLPLLCKDFIIDRLQIDQAASMGADIILLIVAALEESKLLELYHYARSLDLEVLVEVHNIVELETALKTEARMIGVNNRDLKTFNVSLDVTESLALRVRESGAFLISESGIHQQEDVNRVRTAGANGILVGEALMKSTDIKTAFHDFRLPLARGVKK